MNAAPASQPHSPRGRARFLGGAVVAVALLVGAVGVAGAAGDRAVPAGEVTADQLSPRLRDAGGKPDKLSPRLRDAGGKPDKLSPRLQDAGGAADELSPRLQDVSGTAPTRVTDGGGTPSRGPGSIVRDAAGRLVVDVRMDGPDQAPMLVAAGARLLASSGVMATVAVPSRRLEDVAAHPQVRYVTPVVAPLRAGIAPTAVDPSCGTGVVSEGVAQLGVDDARTTHRLDGAGITVGVLSDSFDALSGAADDVAAAELPGPANSCGRALPVEVLEGAAEGTDEGRAMLQIVHDVAPGAELAFATAGFGELAMAQNIRQLGIAGAEVITDDIVYLSEPLYQDSAIGAAIIENRRDRDVVHVSSAGNSNVVVDGRDVASYEAPAHRPAACPPAVLWVGAGYGACHDFAPGAAVDTTSRITLRPGGSFVLMLGWSEPRLGVATDLDLLVVEGGVVVAAGTDESIASGNPVEYVVHRNTSGAPQQLDVVVARWGVGGTPRFKTVLLRSSDVAAVEYDRSGGGDVVGPTMIGHAATEAAISVAAVPYDDVTSIQPYSSRGPALRCWATYDGSGPLPPIAPCRAVDVDVAATDGVANSFFGTPVSGVRRFFGTSAAAPHVAGVAALAREFAPCATAGEIESAIRSGAVGLAGFGTPAAGAGRVDATGTIAALPTDCDPGRDPATFVSADPARYLDTRPTGDTFDGHDRGGGRTPAGGRVEVRIAGRGTVPNDATAVVANLTAVNGTGVGYATAHPCLANAPTASSVNFRAGGLEPNEVIVKLDARGRICIDVFGADTFLLLDVVGHTLADSAYTPIEPRRYADSRPAGSTFDGRHVGGGPIAPGTTIEIAVAGRGGVPDSAIAAAINVTATQGEATGYATVHACLRDVPNASSVNYAAGVSRPNEIVAALSPAGTICITVGDAAVHLVVDVVGHLTSTTTFTSVVPARLADTRPSGRTIDDGSEATGPAAPGSTTRVQVTGRSGVPTSATTAVVNLTVAGAPGTGYVTVHPCLPSAPNASSINYLAGTVRPNELVARLDPTGGICITVGESAAQLIVDVTGHDG